MAQQEIEVILLRQLASYLAMPIFIVDPRGTLVFYNEPAETILGKRFEETGEMSAEEWSTAFQPTDEQGRTLEAETVPLMIALNDHRPTHGSLWIRGLDGVRRRHAGVDEQSRRCSVTRGSPARPIVTGLDTVLLPLVAFAALGFSYHRVVAARRPRARSHGGATLAPGPRPRLALRTRSRCRSSSSPCGGPRNAPAL